MKQLKSFFKYFLPLWLFFSTASYFLNHDTATFCLGSHCAEGYAQEHFLFSLLFGAFVTLDGMFIVWLMVKGRLIFFRGFFKFAEKHTLVAILLGALALAALLY